MSEPTPPRGHVILLHGIRTHGKWRAQAAELLDRHGWTPCQDYWDYGYFSLLHFLSPWARSAKSPWFRRQYRLEKKEQGIPDAEPFTPDVVAHSFGTYILGYALLKYDYLRVRHVILCGSILPVHFPWGQLVRRGQVCSVRNEYGTADIWTGLTAKFVRGSGPSGALGFAQDASVTIQKQYPRFGHSEFFDREHIEQEWLPFLASHSQCAPRTSDRSIHIPWPPTEVPWLAYLLLIMVVALLFVTWLAIRPVEPHTPTLNLNRQVAHAPFIAARALGLAPSWTFYDRSNTGDRMATRLLKQEDDAVALSVDLVVSNGYSSSIATVPYTIIAVTGESNGADGVLLRTSDPFPLGQPLSARLRALDGVKVAAWRANSAASLLQYALSSSTIHIDLQYKSTPQEALDSYCDGSAQALASYEPYLSIARDRVGGMLVLSTADSGVGHFNISGLFLTQKADSLSDSTVVELLNAYEQGVGVVGDLLRSTAPDDQFPVPMGALKRFYGVDTPTLISILTKCRWHTRSQTGSAQAISGVIEQVRHSFSYINSLAPRDTLNIQDKYLRLMSGQ